MPIQTTRAVPRAVCTDGGRCRIAVSRLPDVASVSQDGVGPSTQHNQAMARNQFSWELDKFLEIPGDSLKQKIKNPSGEFLNRFLRNQEQWIMPWKKG